MIYRALVIIVAFGCIVGCYGTAYIATGFLDEHWCKRNGITTDKRRRMAGGAAMLTACALLATVFVACLNFAADLALEDSQ